MSEKSDKSGLPRASLLNRYGIFKKKIKIKLLQIPQFLILFVQWKHSLSLKHYLKFEFKNLQFQEIVKMLMCTWLMTVLNPLVVSEDLYEGNCCRPFKTDIH